MMNNVVNVNINFMEQKGVKAKPEKCQIVGRKLENEVELKRNLDDDDNRNNRYPLKIGQSKSREKCNMKRQMSTGDGIMNIQYKDIAVKKDQQPDMKTVKKVGQFRKEMKKSQSVDRMKLLQKRKNYTQYLQQWTQQQQQQQQQKDNQTVRKYQSEQQTKKTNNNVNSDDKGEFRLNKKVQKLMKQSMKEVQQKKLIKENEMKLIKTQSILKKQLIQLKNNEIREHNKKRFTNAKSNKAIGQAEMAEKAIRQLAEKQSKAKEVSQLKGPKKMEILKQLQKQKGQKKKKVSGNIQKVVNSNVQKVGNNNGQKMGNNNEQKLVGSGQKNLKLGKEQQNKMHRRNNSELNMKVKKQNKRTNSQQIEVQRMKRGEEEKKRQIQLDDQEGGQMAKKKTLKKEQSMKKLDTLKKENKLWKSNHLNGSNKEEVYQQMNNTESVHNTFVMTPQEVQLKCEQEEQQIYMIIEQAATMIQKVWRGHFTRKVVKYYLEMMDGEQEQDEEQQYEQNQQTLQSYYQQSQQQSLAHSQSDQINAHQQFECIKFNNNDNNYVESKNININEQNDIDFIQNIHKQPSDIQYGMDEDEEQQYEQQQYEQQQYEQQQQQQYEQQQYEQQQYEQQQYEQQQELKEQLQRMNDEQQQKWEQMMSIVQSIQENQVKQQQQSNGKNNMNQLLQKIQQHNEQLLMKQQQQFEEQQSQLQKQQMVMQKQISDQSKKKKSLQIDVEQIEEEHNQRESSQKSNTQDKNQSQQIQPIIQQKQQQSDDIEKQQGATKQQQNEINVSSKQFLRTLSPRNKLMSPMNIDKDLFSGCSFQNYYQQKMEQLVNSNPMMTVLKMRENAIEKRSETELKMIEKQYMEKRVSPKSYSKKKIEIERWRDQQQKQLNISRKEIERGWKVVEETVKRTQKDLQLLQRIKKKDKQQDNYDSLSFHIEQRTDSQNSNVIHLDNEEEQQQQMQQMQSNQQKVVATRDQYVKSLDIVQQIDNEKKWIEKEKKQVDDQKVDIVTESILQQLVSELKKENVYRQEKVQNQKQQKQMNREENIQKIQKQEVIPKQEVIAKQDILSKQDMFKPDGSSSTGKIDQPQQVMGIKSTYENCKEYLQVIVDEILKRNVKEQFINKINVSLGMDEMQKLKYLQNQIINDLLETENCNNSQSQKIQVEIEEVEETVMNESVVLKAAFNIEKKDEKMDELQRIHNRMVFDCLNEQFQKMRPYGCKGRPYSWKINEKQLNPKNKTTDKNIDEVLKNSRDKVLEWAAHLCGFIHDKDDALFYLDEEYLQQIREDRMSKMLAQEVFEVEQNWLQYQDEEAEVAIEIADVLFEQIATETATHLQQIQQQRSQLDYFS